MYMIKMLTVLIEERMQKKNGNKNTTVFHPEVCFQTDKSNYASTQKRVGCPTCHNDCHEYFRKINKI